MIVGSSAPDNSRLPAIVGLRGLRTSDACMIAATLDRQWIFQARIRLFSRGAGFSISGREAEPSGCVVIDSLPLTCSDTLTNPTSPRLSADLPMLPPTPTNRRPQWGTSSRGLRYGVSIFRLRAALPLPMQGWLSAGGPHLCREGVEPWIALTDSGLCPFLLSRPLPDASRVHAVRVRRF